MKKYVFLLSTTLLSIVAIGTFSSTENSAKEEILQVSNYSDQNIVEPIKSEPLIFVARDLDGYIAIFVPDEILPCLVTDINVKTLPLADQELLKTGIIIDADYGLVKFIEDYSS
ncbi:MAG: hypothetical protein R3Y09_05495 [Clostridia bacterium]